ncbi:MAG TPA: hypothetical protein PK498_10765, partial [Candidatus Kapabacteria bacterium]|nr:hypothetical protein [Candidatus Kapabacteria bacterium]
MKSKLGNLKRKTFAKIILCVCLLAFVQSFAQNSNKSIHTYNTFLPVLYLLSPNLFYALGYNFDDIEIYNAMIFGRDTVQQDRLRILKAPEIDRNIYYRQKLPNYITSTAFLDSTLNEFRYTELFDSTVINNTYPVDFDQFLLQRKNYLQNQIWDSLTTSYDLKRALSGGDLAAMIGQSTGLTIPIPPSPISSIFGKPTVSINVNGEVNLRIGWRWDSQNLGTVSSFGQSQSSPIFQQDIRVNVSGQIGDKLRLGTNWNTRRQFEYENEFKVGYEGEDDDIIKKLEFGNIDFQIPSTLIGGGSALFGVRADFQFGPLFLKSVFSQRRGQRKYVDVRGGASKQYFSIRPYDYAKNHFFLDTAYWEVY